MKSKKYKLKKGYGKLLRLTTPTKRITITDSERLLTEEEFSYVKRYVDEVKPEKKERKKEKPVEEPEVAVVEDEIKSEDELNVFEE